MKQQVVHTTASAPSTSEMALILCSWEGSLKTGITLSISHKLSDIPPMGILPSDSSHAYAPTGVGMHDEIFHVEIFKNFPEIPLL